ncbi:pyocin knob domain-containing protein [Oscillospiraceae bacterium MB08-C2-2]|nr:pyocin knob domain-containing protein [Oscillospiraceae bacterium MB08-C2-2]
MSYSKKTANYNLPQWEPNDKPSMRDYNEAFTAVDSQLTNKVNVGYGLGEAASDISNQDWLTVMAKNAGGWYCGSNVTNAPTVVGGGVGWYTFILNPLTSESDKYQTCIAISLYYKRIYFGTRYNSTWSGWKELATAEPLQELAIPFATEYKSAGESTYFKSQDKVVSLNIDCMRKDAGDIISGSIIATLPEGYRPSRNIMCICLARELSGNTSNYGHAYIRLDGSVEVYFPSTIKRLYFNATFLAK